MESSSISRDLPPSPGGHHTSAVPLAKDPSWSSHLIPVGTQDATELIGAAHHSDLSLDTALERLKLTEKPPMRMFSMIAAVLEQIIAHDASIDLGLDDWQVQLEYAEQISQYGQEDVEALRLIQTMLDRIWVLDREDDLVKIAILLADGSREPEWRGPFGESSILDFFLRLMASENENLELRYVALRLIGNTCADTDVNRERVISQDYLPYIIKQLRSDELVDLAISVLFNICMDYEPAQLAARSNKLFLELIELLASDTCNHSLIGSICPLLNYSLQESTDADQCPDHSIRTLLQIASEPWIEVEDLTSFVNIIIIFLELERFQKLLIAQNLVPIPLLIIIRSVSPEAPSISSLSVTRIDPLVRDPEEEEQLSSARSALIRALSDVSATAEFERQYPIGSSLVDSLVGWLSSSIAHFQTCSCIMLGNLARSDAVCATMVQNLHLHETLASVLKDSSDLQVLHSVLGFLRNLALPTDNKAPMGTAGIIEAVSRIWFMEFGVQLHYVTLGLIRQLLNGSMVNVQRLLSPLSPDPESPAHEKTYFSLILSLFDKTDQMPVKLEIARITAAIWRCLNNTDRAIECDNLNATIFKLVTNHPNILAPLTLMVCQSRWPVLRSEGWFALALMARTREGTIAINNVLRRVEVFGALVEIITGQPIAGEVGSSSAAAEPESGSEPSDPGARAEQQEEMRIRDRENAMVLINELLKNSGDDMSLVRRNVLEDLLRGRRSELYFQEVIIEAQLEE